MWYPKKKKLVVTPDTCKKCGKLMKAWEILLSQYCQYCMKPENQNR